MARSLNIRRSIIALILGTILAGCGSSSSAVTPQPEGAQPTTLNTPAAATVVATPAANGTPVPSDADVAATIVAAPASP